MNREYVITYMEVSDADVLKAANSAFLPGAEVLPNDDWTDLEPDRVQSGRRFPRKHDEQEDPVIDDGWSRGSRTVIVDTLCSTPE